MLHAHARVPIKWISRVRRCSRYVAHKPRSISRNKMCAQTFCLDTFATDRRGSTQNVVRVCARQCVAITQSIAHKKDGKCWLYALLESNFVPPSLVPKNTETQPEINGLTNWNSHFGYICEAFMVCAFLGGGGVLYTNVYFVIPIYT